MDEDAEAPRVLNHGDQGERRPGGEEEGERRWKRPPSSYGSMKSDSDEEEGEVEDELEDEVEDGDDDDEEDGVAYTAPDTLTFESPAPPAAGLQPPRSASPETLYTMTTQVTKPPGAMVIDTRAADCLEDDEEKQEGEEDDILYADSPEPPELVESDEVMQTEDNSQPGRLHPLQDLSHIFKNILATLRKLTREELFKFKLCFSQWQPFLSVPDLMEGDVLDFVDKIIEVLGQDCALLDTLRTLNSVNKAAEAQELQKTCDRAWLRYHLKTYLIRKHEVIHEGVPRPGKRSRLNTIYVQPQISVCGFGGVASSPPSPLLDTSIPLNDLFRLRKEDGRPVRTAMTTGIPGMGMTVSVGKFCLDWAALLANKDLQFIIKLPFRTFWRLRDKPSPSKMMSIMEVIEYHHLECKNVKCLEEADCKFLIIMDSFDCYQATLDWENCPVLTDSHTPAHPDVLIVNLIRGNLLPGASVWILGRRAAVSQIPAELIDVVTELQGFSDEMKVDYLTRRFPDGALAAKIVAHYQRLPMLQMLCQQPFICWMVATSFENSYRYVGYGVKPPKLTPYYINILLVQTNRKLQFYYNQTENQLKWSSKDKHMLMQMGKMALMMLEKKSSVFFEEDLKEHGLELREVTVFSGLCTELPAATSAARRSFCFAHLYYQEFMAALYVFGKFHMESQSKNVLDSGSKTKMFAVKGQSKSAVGLLHSALDRTLKAPPGQYDMFLLFLCGLLCPGCHKTMLEGNLFLHNSRPVAGLGEVQQLLEETIESAAPGRLANLKECLRELTQEET